MLHFLSPLLRGILRLAASDDFLFKDLHYACFRQIHRINNHHFQVIIGDSIFLQVKQKIVTFYIATIGEINSKVKLDTKL